MAGALREAIRRFARQENEIGFACSFVLSLFQNGWKETTPMLLEHHTARISLKDIPELHLPEGELARQRAAAFPGKLRFSVLTPLYNTPEDLLREMIDSVRSQTYADWELCLADGSDDAHAYVGEICEAYAREDPRILYRKLAENRGISENTNACIDMAAGEYVALLDHDDLLLPSALYENRKAIEETGADFLYSDEAVFESPDHDRLFSTHFKPAYAPDDLLSNNYICHLSVFRRSLLEKAGRFRRAFDGSQDHDLILRLTGCAEKVAHIPKALYLWRSHAASVASDITAKPYAVDAGRAAVKDFLKQAKGIGAEVESAPVFPALYRVRWPVAGHPAVSVILYARERPADMAWMGKLKEFTARENTEWIPADGEGTESEQLNAAARKAGGEYLLFLEEGLWPDGPGWIDELLGLAQREDTGAAGARVLFEDGRIRHAGIAVGFGRHRAAGRLFFRYKGDLPVYVGKAGVVEDVSAVSAECLMIRKAYFEEAGGFDAAYGSALYDVDLCLKLREKGRLVVYTPWPEMKGGRMWRKALIELGRDKPGYRQAAKRFREKWKGFLDAGDPYYHPRFSRDRMVFQPDRKRGSDFPAAVN